MYQVLRLKGFPTELHIYGSTTHDFSVRRANRSYDDWTSACERWLMDQKILLRKR